MTLSVLSTLAAALSSSAAWSSSAAASSMEIESLSLLTLDDAGLLLFLQMFTAGGASRILWWLVGVVFLAAQISGPAAWCAWKGTSR